MHIDYTVTPEDLIAFNIYVNRSTALFRRKRRKSLLVFSLIAIVLFIIAYFVQRNLPLALVFFFAALATLTIGVTTYIAVATVLRRTTQKLIREGGYKGVLGSHGVSLTPEAVETTSAAGKAQLLWTAIERIDVTLMAIYFFLAETRGYIIPRHSFAHDAEYHTFEQLANHYHTAARRQSIPANEA